MNQDEAAAGAGGPAEESAQDGEHKQDEPADGREQPRQGAWEARRHLLAHGPDFVLSTLTRDQYGQTGGTHHGDQNFYFGGGPEPSSPPSGPVPEATVKELEGVFRGCPSFDEAFTRLKEDKLVILAGGHDTGRRSAALMLLHRLGIGQLRSLEPDTPFSSLAAQVDDQAGYVLYDLTVSRSRPLREEHVWNLRSRLEQTGARMVITVEPSAVLGDVPSVRWEPPSAEQLLHAHVTPATGEAAWPALCELTAVREFLERGHRPAEIKKFAPQVIAYHRGQTTDEALAAHGQSAVPARVRRWLTEPKPELRDKAFLVSLAVFHKAPYAVTAELADRLFVALHKIEDPNLRPRIPVFGSSREARLRLAHAHGYVEAEVTDRGPLEGKFHAAFRDEDTAPLLLEQVWNLHPSARPALAEWIRKLADDRRPLVRTRAASAAALLAKADLPSALAHLIEPWADSRSHHAWLTASNSLTMAELLGVPTIPEILHDWCTGEAESRRWTAIRAFGLLGPVHYEATLAALVDAMHRRTTDESESGEDGAEQQVPEEARQLADALELLLLAVRDPVLAALTERRTDRAVRPHALLAFLQASRQTKDDDTDRPPVLDWYARAAAVEDTATTEHLVEFWNALLADRTHHAPALAVLRGWVRRADNDPEIEAALASLFTALIETPPNHRRIGHLLRTVRDAQGITPTAARLREHLALD